jgi:hypothetical protein
MHDPHAQAGPTVARPLLVGWKERVDLPEWKLRHLRVKIDTGARTSALDVLSYDLHETPDHGLIAELRLALNRRRPDRVKVIQTAVLGMVLVLHPNGMCERRPVVETILRLGPVTKRVRLTLTNRAKMRFRMILGRTALEGDFIVDVSKKYLLESFRTE